MSGNLCRCTGYRPIRDAALALGEPGRRRRRSPSGSTCRTGSGADAAPTDAARPVDLAEALALLRDHPDATVVAGSTDYGVEVNLRGRRSPFVVYVDRLPELRTISTSQT